MQLSQLEYLQAVANYGGVRKAARAVHVSPQAVSSAIKKLESEYQIVLLDRSAGEAVLSPAGREFACRFQVSCRIDGEIIQNPEIPVDTLTEVSSPVVGN